MFLYEVDHTSIRFGRTSSFGGEERRSKDILRRREKQQQAHLLQLELCFIAVCVSVRQGDDRGGRGRGRYDDPYEDTGNRGPPSKRGGVRRGASGAGGFDLTGTITKGNKSEGGGQKGK